MHLQTVKMGQAEDRREFIENLVGDLSWLQLIGSRIIVGMLIDKDKTAGGVYLPQTKTDESKHQSKIGILLAMGPDAFEFDGQFKWEGPKAKIGDCLLYRPIDGHSIAIGQKGKAAPCLLMDYRSIIGILPESHLDRVW